MDTQKFIRWAIKAVVDYFNSRVDVTDRKALAPDDVYVVWSCKTLGNNKALLKKLKVHTEDTAAENLPGEEDDNNE